MLAMLSLVQQLLSVGAGAKRSHISGINLNVKSIAAFLFAMAASVAAIIFMMIALQGWLAMVITSPYAVPLSWLCCGLVALVVAGISVTVAKGQKEDHGLISLAYSTPKATHTSSPAHSQYGAVNGSNPAAAEHKSPFDETFIKNITEEVAAKIEDHPLTSVVLAGLAGMAAGKSMEHR
ncbi:MAG: hypothetical protein JWO78_1504 [Micavibrio sp.]|nr:hypothetical protein [Micavibrio sp.]